MLSREKRRIIYGQSLWMILVIFWLYLTGGQSLELFFVMSLVGFLFLVDVSTPTFVQLRWHKRLRRVAVAGIIAFIIVMSMRVFSLLAPSLS